MISRRKILLSSVSCLLLPSLTGCSQGHAHSNWKFSKENPILGGKYGSCFDPDVLYDGSIYRMWFSMRRKQGIAYTQSHDAINWTPPQIVLGIDPQQPEETDINRCSVIKHGSGYLMFYTGQTHKKSYLYVAESPDGLSWSRSISSPILKPELPWEKTSVMCPDVLFDNDSRQFRLYYSAGEQYEPDCIGLATSTDGYHWDKQTTPIFSADPKHPWERSKVTACDIHYINGWYYMFYIGFADVDHASICLARSRNGIDNWQRHPQNPILDAPGKSSFFEWDRDAIYKPAAVPTATGWIMFFNARRHHREQIGLVTHKGLDLGFE